MWYAITFIVGVVTGSVLMWIYKSKIKAKAEDLVEKAEDIVKGG